jgi:hypothetical protein
MVWDLALKSSIFARLHIFFENGCFKINSPGREAGGFLAHALRIFNIIFFLPCGESKTVCKPGAQDFYQPLPTTRSGTLWWVVFECIDIIQSTRHSSYSYSSSIATANQLKTLLERDRTQRESNTTHRRQIRPFARRRPGKPLEFGIGKERRNFLKNKNTQKKNVVFHMYGTFVLHFRR